MKIEKKYGINLISELRKLLAPYQIALAAVLSTSCVKEIQSRFSSSQEGSSLSDISYTRILYISCYSDFNMTSIVEFFTEGTGGQA